jgi:pimeloyl-ACP methyl ester carboxylesterase
LICDQSVWQHQTDALADIADCSVADYGSLDTITAMAVTVLRSAPERFSLAGHSMGGRVALEIYRLAPNRVERLGLFNTGYLPHLAGATGVEESRRRWELVALARSRGMRAMLNEWLPPMIDSRRLTDTALVNSIVEMMSRKTPDILEAQVRALLARPDATAVLGKVHCPTLLLTGREDGWSPPALHEEMRARIEGSHLVVVPDCGHMSMLERPAEVSAAMRTWLSQPV